VRLCSTTREVPRTESREPQKPSSWPWGADLGTILDATFREDLFPAVG
jgi:hypothetical protein